MIEFKDPFGTDTIITILPVMWNGRVSLSISSRRDYVTTYDLDTAKKMVIALQEAITILEQK